MMEYKEVPMIHRSDPAKAFGVYVRSLVRNTLKRDIPLQIELVLSDDKGGDNQAVRASMSHAHWREGQERERVNGPQEPLERMDHEELDDGHAGMAQTEMIEEQPILRLADMELRLEERKRKITEYWRLSGS
ncbi:unnamed protein product [Bursaphelenchus xylophilus]|uniref:(pine wood nematode) hypothetical protein n=1 Tax=Bursaphelenchus xylophilus TaxID=6326 RepID=A0A1I7RLU7_BURXY|nr:unnamed protein product [Bursaphelenchus xylophilus]CAG9106229.1 unnamed protein product [Bursaphelenchus xylophilus]